MAHKWLDIVESNGLKLEDRHLALLDQYHHLLAEWNGKMNLVSRKDEKNIWPNHILHSISLLFTLKIRDGSSLADIGSGGGLPGVPLAILLPNIRVVMIESIKKKCAALNDMITRLGLKNALAVNGRAEEVGKSKQYSNQFDIVVARAVAPLKDLVIWSEPLVRNIGSKLDLQFENLQEEIQLPVLVSMKGGDLAQELAAAKQMKLCKSLRSYELLFHGIEKTGLIEKKIVIMGL